MSGRRRRPGALQIASVVGLCGAAALASAEPSLPAVPAVIESRVPSVDALLHGGSGRVPAEVERALGSARPPGLPGLMPHPDDSSKSIEGTAPKLRLAGKVKDCCGYPLGQPGTFKLTFYWLAYESEYASEPADIDIYTKDGFLIGRFPRVFVFELKLEGTGVLRDGRVLNYDRPCPFGIGICFKELDRREHPVGKGAQQRALVPYRSVAVDPRFVPLGTPLYVPELRGMPILTQDPSQPEERHDGCVRADDTGGGIKRRELDLFVSSYPQYRATEAWLLGSQRITPMVEEPRCEYLRGLGGPYGHADPGQDRKSEATDWAALHPAKAAPTKKPGRAVASSPLRRAADKHGAGKGAGKTAQSATKPGTPRRHSGKTAAG